ncbi:hybrid sensor histidine kinase/response regulator [Bacillus sp. FJAT-42315]|uniref:hybrid sensor histidine kinase/response regulator n=1 Tax=Bacillus sp. FJAT-42315 TaxID=2014077 RepID=UPI000C241731|nr:ATP-binding protein [Bacillus sp. FJAT-42315]
MFNFQYVKIKKLLFVFIILLMLTGIRMIWIAYQMGPDQPTAHQGVLDLRNYELSENQTIVLDGEWEFFSDTLWTPQLEEPSQDRRMLVSVPKKGHEDVPYPFGTYRLKILLPSDIERVYGIRVQSSEMVSKLFINGRQIVDTGQATHQGQVLPYTALFSADQEAIDIVLQVSNFQSLSTVGIEKSIKFGFADSVINEQKFDEALQVIVAVVLVLHGFGTVYIYFFFKSKKDVSYFTAVLFCMTLATLVEDSKVLLQWLPLNYEWFMRLIKLSYLGVAFFLLQFVKEFLSVDKKDKVVKGTAIFYGVYALLVLIMPPQSNMLVLIFLSFLVLYIVIFVSLLVFSPGFHEKGEGPWLVFSSLCMLSSATWGLIKTYVWPTLPYYPFDIILSFFGVAAFWFKCFFMTTTRVEELVAELKKADKAKDDFLANSSHELRNPLNAIINIAQTVLDSDKASLGQENKKNLELLITVGRRMSFMLNDLLDVTRLKENGMRIQPKSVKVQAVTVGVIDMLKFLMEGKPIQMVSDIPDSFPPVWADKDRLVQILFNLLHNAVKYTNEGTIVVQARMENEMAVIHVKDSGIGIDEEMQKKVFDPYERGDLNSLDIGGGLGLGLSICQQLVALHGGTIAVHSVPHQGSDFYFTLPLAENSIEEQVKEEGIGELCLADERKGDRVSSSNIQPITGEKARILAVDDDPINLKVLSSVLSSRQYEVVTAMSGKEALSLLDQLEYDLVITDVMMPNMSGYELTENIRKRYSILELPILLLTARSQPEDVATGFAAGANDYVMKPLNALELKARTQALIDFKLAIGDRLRMEAALLQAQIQPHFLFNALNTIASLSTLDTSRMVSLLEHFGQYLRASFDLKNLQKFVPLENELQLLRSYLYIEKERFGNRLQVHWEVDEQLKVEIPPLSIQPLVENAVKHGVLQRARGGTVWIKIVDYVAYTEISIKDDGVGMSEKRVEQVLSGQNDSSRGIGLFNTNRRLQQLYGEGLQIRSVVNEGTEVCFTIPRK